MLTTQVLFTINKEDIPRVANDLLTEDIAQLIEWLKEKNDDIRYPALLLLIHRSKIMMDVYPYWDIFCNKLKDNNSYQRSIGIMLIAENSRWDAEEKLSNTLEEYLAVLQDEKPITVRQCIQALKVIVENKPHLNSIIADRLMNMDLSQTKETMRKLILSDIIYLLIDIRNSDKLPTIDSYISNALTGEILDKKTKKLIESRM